MNVPWSFRINKTFTCVFQLRSCKAQWGGYMTFAGNDLTAFLAFLQISGSFMKKPRSILFSTIKGAPLNPFGFFVVERITLSIVAIDADFKRRSRLWLLKVHKSCNHFPGSQNEFFQQIRVHESAYTHNHEVFSRSGPKAQVLSLRPGSASTMISAFDINSRGWRSQFIFKWSEQFSQCSLLLS